MILSLFLALGAAAQNPCTIPGLTGDVQCTTVRVPEDRSKPNGRQLGIFVVIARATGDRREPDPFLYLAGGPGQAASESGEFASQAFSRVREHRDLAFIDARGTGRSNPLRCALNRKPADLGAASMYPAASVRFCRDSLSRTVDLRRYTSADIADDIESVRVAMGWPKLNFYGTSYGTRLGFTFLRRHESSVRTMTLKAVAPPSLTAPMNYAEDAEHAFALLERDCRADTACARAFPSPRADLMRVLARADSGRIRTVMPSGDTIVVARDAIAGTLMSAMQSNGERSRLPALLRQAALTDGSVLGGLIAQTRRTIDAMLYTGMHLSASCSEDAKHLDLSAARRTDGTTFLGSARADAHRCVRGVDHGRRRTRSYERAAQQRPDVARVWRARSEHTAAPRRVDAAWPAERAARRAHGRCAQLVERRELWTRFRGGLRRIRLRQVARRFVRSEIRRASVRRAAVTTRGRAPWRFRAPSRR